MYTHIIIQTNISNSFNTTKLFNLDTNNTKNIRINNDGYVSYIACMTVWNSNIVYFSNKIKIGIPKAKPEIGFSLLSFAIFSVQRNFEEVFSICLNKL